MKRFLFIASFMVLFVVGSLFATDYNVIVYPANEDISSYVKTLIPTKTFDKNILDLMEERAEVASMLKLGEALDKAWDRETEESIKTARAAYNAALEHSDDEIDLSDFNVVVGSVKGTYDVDAMVAGDVQLLDYICFVNNADMILIPVISNLQGFNHMAIYEYGYGSQELKLVYEGIANDSNRFTIRSVLELSKLFSDETPAILRLDNLVTGATVMVDRKEVPVLDSYVLTTEGEHTISVVAQGYVGRAFTTTLAGGEVSSLNATMLQMHFEALSINSNPSAQVIVDGSVVGETPMVLDLYSVPLNLRLTADGYSDSNISILSRTSGIEVELKPEWMANKDLLKVQKDGFYGAFARSLLIFGAKIALRSFNDGSNAVLSALDIATNAAIAVSLSDLVGCLIDYYRQTEYIAR